MIPDHVLQSYRLQGPAQRLRGGSVAVYRVDDLVVKRLLPPLKSQLIHGDLNPETILVAPGLPAGFIDLTPPWGPVDFALDMFANWIGPRQCDPSVLRHIADIAHFDQLLIRAAIRYAWCVTQLRKTPIAGRRRCSWSSNHLLK